MGQLKDMDRRIIGALWDRYGRPTPAAGRGTAADQRM